jgi:hypothetical protein
MFLELNIFLFLYENILFIFCIKYLMSNQPIIFFFVGDISNKKIITEFTSYTHPNLTSIKADNKRIFNKFCLSNEIKIGERLKINDNSSLVYNFIILAPTIYFFVCTTPKYKDELSFKLIDEIYEEKVYAMKNDKGELNDEGRQKLKKIIDKYQDPNINKIYDILNKVDSIKVIVKDSIQKVVNNTQRLDELEKKSQMLKEKGKDFHKNAKETERITWWHNCKIKIILFLILTIIIGLIAYKIIYR